MGVNDNVINLGIQSDLGKTLTVKVFWSAVRQNNTVADCCIIAATLCIVFPSGHL